MEAVKFPIWPRPVRGPWNLGVVTGIVPPGVTCGAGRPVAIVSEPARKVVIVFWCSERGRLFCAERGSIPG